MSEQKSIILIHPPVTVPSAPPAGLARLAGFLREAGIHCRTVDLNIEGITGLAATDIEASDTWTRRAKGGARKNLEALRSPPIYRDFDRYKRAVSDINRVLNRAGAEKGATLSLANYAESTRSPLRRSDLMAAALDFENNLFFPFFEKTLSRVFSEVFSDRVHAVAAISVTFISQALCAAAVAGFIRKHAPSARIVFGGGLVTSWMKIPGFTNPLDGIVDDMISGPGESILAAMAHADSSDPAKTRHRSANPAPVPGFPYDFKDFPLETYLSPMTVLPLAASDGCYWRKCAFCPEKTERKRYRPFPPSAAAAVPELKERTVDCRRESLLKPVLLHFTDNALAPRFMKYLIDHPPGVPWYGFARITPHLADQQFAAGLAASGCVMLKLGIESGDQKVLDAMGKGAQVAVISRALRTLRAAGIAVYGYLLFGTPAENEKRAFATRDFILDHADCIDFLNLAIFNLPAYGHMARTLETKPFSQGELSLYREFVHPEGWRRDRVRRFLAKSLKREPAIRKIILNDPPFFTSSHAPFFRMGAHEPRFFCV